MKVVDLPITSLKEAPWNSNRMDEAMIGRLRKSTGRYGLVQNLVVRPLERETYEVLSGNQRLRLLRELDIEEAPCVVVDLNDAHARLLAQALNHIQGEDDLGLRAEALRKILEDIPGEEVLALLPETAESLRALSSLSQDTIASYLQNWQQAQAARLKHLRFQLTPAQLDVVEEALRQFLPQASNCKDASPNVRSTALYLLCKFCLERENKP